MDILGHFNVRLIQVGSLKRFNEVLKKDIVYEPSGADGTSASKDKIGCHMTNIVSGDRQGGITLLEDLILPTFCLV